EIEREATHVVRKLEQLAGHHLFKAVQLGNAVADLDDRSDFRNRDSGFEVLNLFANDVVDFAGSNWFHVNPVNLENPVILSNDCRQTSGAHSRIYRPTNPSANRSRWLST